MAYRIRDTWQVVRRMFALAAVALMAGHAQAADVTIPPRPEFRPVPATATHVQLLRQGGLVIYMRHGATDARFPDRIPVQIDDCGSQRPLTDAGRAQLDQIGKHFARLRIPYDKTISSPFCRAVESARRVFGEPVEVDLPLRYTAAMPEAEKAPAVARTREWVSRKVDEPGRNRVVVAHGPNIAEIMDYLPSEGTLVIFRPLGEGAGFEYIASIEPAHWPALLKELGLQ
jgi:broad specificity phosphatase PhoE